MLDNFFTNQITDWATAMIRAIWQGGIVLGLVWIVLRLFPKIHPNLRCWSWRLAYLKLLLAFFGIGLFQIASISQLEIPLSHRGLIDGVTVLKSNPVVQWIGAKPGILNLVSPNFSVFSIPKGWFFLWVIGLGGFGVYLMILWQRNRMALKSCYLAPSQMELGKLYQELCGELKIKRAPRLFLSHSLCSPSLEGLIQPKIILPMGVASQYQPNEIRLMLAHELAHYKRGDLFWNWLPIIARWLFFFHPVVWLAEREWKQLHEICSDRLAVQVTKTGGAEYGRLLLKAACRSAAINQPAVVQPGVFPPRFNLHNDLAEYYAAESKQALKKRLLALNYPERIPRKWLLISVLTVALVGAFAILPWKLTLVESPTIYISVQYSNNSPPAPLIKIFGGVLHAGDITIKKAEIIVDDQYITPWGYTANTFEGYWSYRVSGPFRLDELHRIKLLVTTTSGSFQEKYDFYLKPDTLKNGLWINYTL